MKLNQRFVLNLILLLAPVLVWSHSGYVSRRVPELLSSQAAFAFSTQQATLTGTVYFENMLMVGVTVSNTSQNLSTLTDENGKFSLAAQMGDVLTFGFTGFKTVTITVENYQPLKIALQEDVTALQEVTVNAGYYKVKDKERTGSIAKITAKDIEKQPVSNVLAALAGRMAGVQIIQDSGAPGGAFQIKIRGQNSLRSEGNQPLYIIDGVPYSAETIGATSTSGAQPTLTSPLNSINPNDIESIEILKDSDATAIYGSRGANGVVLITTKKGKSGKTSLNVTASTSSGRVTKMLNLMDTPQYLKMREQAFAQDGVSTYPANAYDVNGTWDRNRYTDWQKELIGGTAQVSNLQVGLSGGNAQTQFMLSVSTREESTVFPGDFKYHRGSARFNMNHQSPDERLKVVFTAGYTVQRNYAPMTDLTRISRRLAPNAPALYDANGDLNWENGSWDNPLAAFEQKFRAKINDLNAHGLISYQLLPQLQFQTSLGYTEVRNHESLIQPHTFYNPAYGLGSESSSLNLNQTTRSSWIAEPQLNWKKQFGAAKIEALLGGTFQSQTTSRLFSSGYGFSSNSLIYDLASAYQKYVDFSDEALYKYQAFYTRVNLNYKERYLLNMTGRRDGSSRFGPGKQYADFGAVGVAWIFSQEKWLDGKSALSFGKLRGSYGITGNDQIGDYQFLDTYFSSGNTYQGVAGLEPIRLFNAKFGWETNRKLELALETGFFKDRLFTTLAYYRNRSSNQLVGVPLPGTTGFSSLTANLDAEVENSGYELTLRTLNFKGKQFSWETNFNLAANRNKLLSFPGLAQSSYANQYVVGQPINIVKVYHYTGIHPTTGVYQFADVNGDGVINSSGDRQSVADLNPEYFGGVQNQLNYKNWQLDFLFQFVKQRAFTYAASVPGVMVNQLASVSGFWQAHNDTAPYQVLTAGANGSASTAYSRFNSSDAVLVDASFVRLKSISVSYDLPLHLTAAMKCRLYLQGQNLLTFTSFAADPEFKFAGYLPPLKTLTAGVQLTF